MNCRDNLQKIIDGVESALSFKQSDFGVLATHYFDQLDNGERDEIDLYIAFKKVEKFVETILPLIKDKVDEDKLINSYSKHHVKLTTQNTRSFYDFSNCGDVEYNQLNLTASETKEAIKEREDYLKTITVKTDIVDEETGEVTTLLPPIKKQGKTVILRYDKV